MFSLDDCRRFYAEEIQFAANLTSPVLVAALTRVPREKFLGPGPWHVAIPDMVTGCVQYMTTPDAEPRRVYHNVVFALDRSRDLTNGQPGTLAHYINSLDLAPGNRVYHLGAGAGYYTAVIAEVVGSSGVVVASEVHPELGPVAQKNLADRANVTLHVGDGTQFDPGECDAMLINAGVTDPSASPVAGPPAPERPPAVADHYDHDAKSGQGRDAENHSSSQWLRNPACELRCHLLRHQRTRSPTRGGVRKSAGHGRIDEG
jgi:protein-L-isoaspartate O-methyltransferase